MIYRKSINQSAATLGGFGARKILKKIPDDDDDDTLLEQSKKHQEGSGREMMLWGRDDDECMERGDFESKINLFAGKPHRIEYR